VKKFLNAMLQCFAMFTVFPAPFCKWDDSSREFMLLCLPVVGVCIGLLWTLLAALMQFLNIPTILAAAILCAYPFVITGYIHLDGFLDVTDAVRSYRDIEQRRKILKDPHVGAFAVVNCCLLLVMQFALFAATKPHVNCAALILIPTISRIMSAIAVLRLSPMSHSEYANIGGGRTKRPVIILLMLLILTAALGFFLFEKYGWLSVAVVAGYLLALRKAVNSLGGMSGDIAGYALTLSELCGITVYALI